MARQTEATRRVCARTMITAGAAGQESASATTARKIKLPVVIAAAEKCIARMTTKGPSIPAPSQSIGLPAALLADLECEIAVRRMRVHGKDVPRDMVRSSAPRA